MTFLHILHRNSSCLECTPVSGPCHLRPCARCSSEMLFPPSIFSRHVLVLVLVLAYLFVTQSIPSVCRVFCFVFFSAFLLAWLLAF